MKNNTLPRRKNDELLKCAFEDHFVYFLRFLYPDADSLFDLKQGFTFMDKELAAIIPDRGGKHDRRVADLLVKVHLNDGQEKHILINTEIEGKNDQSFAFRLFQYNYRASERYNIDVATIAVYTGGKRQQRPAKYSRNVLDTNTCFDYRCYHIFDHHEDELLEMDNPFGLVVLACQKSLLEGKVPEIELARCRLIIAKAMLKKNYPKKNTKSFLVFLKNILYIENKEFNRKFDQEIQTISGGNINMGVIELIKRQAVEQAVEQAAKQVRKEERAKAKIELSKERLKSKAKDRDNAIKLKQSGIDPKIISDLFGFSLKEIEKL